MKTDNMRAWTAGLRTTPFPQAYGYLSNLVVDPLDQVRTVGFCCLGIGEMKATGTAPRETSRKHPKREFIEWLGLPVPPGDSGTRPKGYDLVIDFPDGVGDHRSVTCAILNDGWHLTFPQIADVVDYFGIREAVAVT